MRRVSSSALIGSVVLCWTLLALNSSAAPPPQAIGPEKKRFVVKCGVGLPVSDQVIVYVHNDGDTDVSFRVAWINRGGLTFSLTPVQTLTPGRIAFESLGPLGFSPGNEQIVAKVTASGEDILVDAELVGDAERRQLTCTPSKADPDPLPTGR